VTLAFAVVLVTSHSLRAARPVLPQLVAVAVFDTGANVLVAIATTEGSVGIVGVLSALYPIVTVVLARVFLGERLSASRRVGGVIAVAGAALVAAG
jgi:drug/metabolite transporter (DMT)-like permease